jgi:diguanylate cyclase
MSNKRNNSDLGMAVIGHMVKNGIATLPRNYEVYYSAFSGNYPELRKKITLLGSNPLQSEIDELAEKFFPERLGESVVQRVGQRMGKQVETLQKEVRNQAQSISNFAAAVENAEQNVELTKESAIAALTQLLRHAGITKAEFDGFEKSIDGHQAVFEQQLQEVNHWKKRAYTDDLTQLMNRAAFNDAVNAIYEKNDSDRYSLILFDVDHFKRVNDTYGHPFGDSVLRMVSKVTQQNVRDSFIARYGGEEFAIILKNVSSDNIAVICNRLRLAIEKMPFQTGLKGFNGVTISLGSCMAIDAENANELISRADEALYFSKNSGRNRYVHWTPEVFKPDQTTGGNLKMYR